MSTETICEPTQKTKGNKLLEHLVVDENFSSTTKSSLPAPGAFTLEESELQNAILILKAHFAPLILPDQNEIVSFCFLRPYPHRRGISLSICNAGHAIAIPPGARHSGIADCGPD